MESSLHTQEERVSHLSLQVKPHYKASFYILQFLQRFQCLVKQKDFHLMTGRVEPTPLSHEGNN
jgi:hypothetical protein